MWNQLFVYIIIIFFDSVKNVQDLEETKQNLNKQIETLESQKHQIKTDLEAGQFELKQSQSEVRNLQTSRDELQEQLETMGKGASIKDVTSIFPLASPFG